MSTVGPFSLAGETALITGGGTGLGFGVAEAFVAAGARVVLTGRREDVLAAAAARLGPGARCEVNDVTDTAAAQELVAKLEAEGWGVTTVVNNAGIHLKKEFTETSEEEFLSVLNTHLLGAYAVTRAAVPAMLERGRGSVIFMASMTSLFGIPKVIAYTAAKAAYLGMVRGLAVELSPRGVRVNAIAPGWIDSPMLRKAMDGDPERSAKVLGRTPMARFGAAEDIGWAAVYLASPAARFVTGIVLPVDGGASIGF